MIKEEKLGNLALAIKLFFLYGTDTFQIFTFTVQLQLRQQVKELAMHEPPC